MVLEEVALFARFSDKTDSISVASTQRSPFTDSHAVSTLSHVDVNDLDRVEVSTYQEDGTNGQL